MYKASWPIPDNVSIAMTNRHGGVSKPPFDSLNLGLHVGDKASDVLANRALIQQRLSITAPLFWLEQVHGTEIVDCTHLSAASLVNNVPPKADGSYSSSPHVSLAIMTADCLPVLLCNKAGTEIAAVHAGWRGLCDGIIETAVKKFSCAPSELMAYLGPAIGPEAFEVGVEVKQQFVMVNKHSAQYFKPVVNESCDKPSDKYLADLNALAKMGLTLLGIKQIFSADTCTHSDKDYFSYRRDQQTGRMASFIWLKS
ncbi:peptidoglycan editing factor PgeF [Shewanella sp. KT0246]|uniref:peptidoglycan editing factor PgeF n=1 Tax=Shewanella sp. KT0246 TaxID=2815912 RepID=UPI001BC38E49|nr:peptidoglycan editing factor PgeF [Shewanella sp. KT0246]GIU52332.1 laccase domain protein [Shewanella sp. KT0246]